MVQKAESPEVGSDGGFKGKSFQEAQGQIVTELIKLQEPDRLVALIVLAHGVYAKCDLQRIREICTIHQPTIASNYKLLRGHKTTVVIEGTAQEDSWSAWET